MRFLLAALVASAGWFALTSRGSRSDRPAPQPRQNGDEHASDAARSKRVTAQGQPDRTIVSQGADHRQRPDDAQRASDERHRRGERRYWAVTGAAAVVATGATIAAAVFAAGAYIAANQQANIAQDALVASTRPWIMLIEIKPDSLASDDEAGITFRVNLFVKNVGHSLAQNVSVSGKLLIADFDPAPDQAMASVCQEPKDGSFIIPGRVLFPDQPEGVRENVPSSSSIRAAKVWAARAARINSARDLELAAGNAQRAQAYADALAEFPFYAPLDFVGCINYRSSDNKALYQTSFMFAIGPKPVDGAVPRLASFPLLSGERPATRYPEPAPYNPEVMMVFPRKLQRIVPGDQIKLGTPLYGTFAN